MSEIVHDINRPDINGIPPKMAAICEQTKLTLAGMVNYLSITTNDNLMSSVTVRGSFQAKEQWLYGIFENSPRFIFMVRPMDGKRYYDPSDPKVSIDLISSCHTLTKFRKYTGPVNKVLAKLLEWIKTNAEKIFQKDGTATT